MHYEVSDEVQVLPGSANIIGGRAVLLKTWHPFLPVWFTGIPGVKAALGKTPSGFMEVKERHHTRMANAALLREALFTLPG